jgi:hypothetical protein
MPNETISPDCGEQHEDPTAQGLWVLLQIREALGDPDGRLMHDELVERARTAWADAQRYRILTKDGVDR